jgi:hypothetical protein
VTVRPNDIDIALVVHVLGAMVLVGGLVTAAAAAVIGWRDESQALRRFAAMTLFAVALPGFLVMRIGAEWVASKEHLNNLPETPTWLGIGYGTADAGGLLLVIALICGGIGARRARTGGGDTLLKVSGAIAVLLVAVYAVAVWAMGGKPG